MNRYKYNSNYFNNIDTQDKAYWLGFIYADGCISPNGKYSRLEVTLADEDTDHLEKLKNTLVKGGKLYSKIRKLKGKEYHHKQLIVSNVEIVNALVKEGCIPNKSLSMKFPSNMNANLVRHFIRGYFDGDGSIWIANNNYNSLTLDICCGCKKFLKHLRDYLLKNVNVTYTKIYRKDMNANCYNIKKQGVEAVKIMRYLYKDANTYLKRKYCIFSHHRHLAKLAKKIVEKNLEP